MVDAEEGATVANDDFITLDFKGEVDGVAFAGGEGKDYPLQIGSHSFIDTFEDQLVGLKVGEEKDVNVTFPEEYHAPDLAGKDAVFTVTVKAIKEKELPELDDEFAAEVSEFDTLDEYKADVKAKINLIVNANKHNLPIMSSMGTANKLDPQKFVITDIYKTHTCPLARIMRKTLKQQGIKKLKVLYSTEEPFTNYTVNFKENTSKDNSPASTRKQPLGSISFVPPIAGLMIAGEIVKDICQINR